MNETGIAVHLLADELQLDYWIIEQQLHRYNVPTNQNPITISNDIAQKIRRLLTETPSTLATLVAELECPSAIIIKIAAALGHEMDSPTPALPIPATIVTNIRRNYSQLQKMGKQKSLPETFDLALELGIDESVLENLRFHCQKRLADGLACLPLAATEFNHIICRLTHLARASAKFTQTHSARRFVKFLSDQVTNGQNDQVPLLKLAAQLRIPDALTLVGARFFAGDLADATQSVSLAQALRIWAWYEYMRGTILAKRVDLPIPILGNQSVIGFIKYTGTEVAEEMIGTLKTMSVAVLIPQQSIVTAPGTSIVNDPVRNIAKFVFPTTGITVRGLAVALGLSVNQVMRACQKAGISARHVNWWIRQKQWPSLKQQLLASKENAPPKNLSKGENCSSSSDSKVLVFNSQIKPAAVVMRNEKNQDHDRPSATVIALKTPQFYVIDGTNVCWWGEVELALQPLLTLLNTFLKRGEDFFCYFDGSTYRKLKDRQAQEIYESLLGEFRMHFVQAPAREKADPYILRRASKIQNGILNCVISRDTFRQYTDQYPWLREATKPQSVRLFGGIVEQDNLILDVLNIDERISTSLVELFAEFRELIAHKTGTVQSALRGQLYPTQCSINKPAIWKSKPS